MATIRPVCSATARKLSGDELAETGVVPPNECFDAEKVLAGERDDRLEVDRQFVAVQGSLQVAVEVEAVHVRFVHRRLEHHHAVLALSFGDVHRRIGVAHHRLGVFPELNECNPDAGPNVESTLGDELPACRTIAGSARGSRRVRLIVHVAQQDGELVATEPSNHVAVADTTLQASSDLDQQRIARGVSEAVVDRLEVVEVDEQDRPVSAVVIVDGLLQMRAEQGAVGQASERIVRRLKRQSALEHPELLERLFQSAVLQCGCGVVGQSLGQTCVRRIEPDDLTEAIGDHQRTGDTDLAAQRGDDRIPIAAQRQELGGRPLHVRTENRGLAGSQQADQQVVALAQCLQGLHLIARPDPHTHRLFARLGEVDQLGSFGVEGVTGMPEEVDDRRFQLRRLVQQLRRLVQEVETLVSATLRRVRPIGQVGTRRRYDQQPGDARLSVENDHRDDAEARREDRRDRIRSAAPARRSVRRQKPVEIEMTTNTRTTEISASMSRAKPPCNKTAWSSGERRVASPRNTATANDWWSTRTRRR